LVLAEFALPVDRQETQTELYQIFESLIHEGDSRIGSDLSRPGNQFSEGFAMAAPILFARTLTRLCGVGLRGRARLRSDPALFGAGGDLCLPLWRRDVRWSIGVGGDFSGLLPAIFKSRRSPWPVEDARTKLGDGHGIERKGGATDRDADRKVC
jgi:hypothetical protein